MKRLKAYASVRLASERCENDAGGLFQHPTLDPLACHEPVRLIDCIDFLHRHIELKSQFIQVPSRIMNLSAWN